ncbi:hypothetical protein GDO81_022401 [Engystomops pustulosus]|uniref:Secreted protein n=1 Tax=Engystomops pustulosus TaxID=76066 RepID=A0AAV6YPK4_ENGPU|nr:hypothetical protein GDO81_022401 [Engystomops pustulosus]
MVGLCGGRGWSGWMVRLCSGLCGPGGWWGSVVGSQLGFWVALHFAMNISPARMNNAGAWRGDIPLISQHRAGIWAHHTHGRATQKIH